MIHEFSGGESCTFRVDPKTKRFTDTVKSYAHEATAPADRTKEAEDHLDDHKKDAAPQKGPGIIGSIQKNMQQVFLPEGYPTSVTDDLLPTAKLELVQQVCGSITHALATRAVLMGIGVGAATANASSSTISWVMRDGVRLIASLFFAAKVSTNLDERSKTWRMVADVCSDFSAMVEVLAKWFPSCFFLLIAFAACLKAVVSVCATGSRTSFAEHFAKIGNTADVITKASNRENIAAFLGLFMGSATMYCTPPDSLIATIFVFLLFTFLHLYANYFCLRNYIMDYLNGPRLEVCIDSFQRSVEDELVHFVRSKDEKGYTSTLLRSSVCTPKYANNSEYLFVLPPPANDAHSLREYMLRFLGVFLPHLNLRIRFGVSLQQVFPNLDRSVSLVHPKIVQEVHESLACRGVALLYHAVQETYYVVFPEYFTSNGQPASWEPFRRRAELLRLACEGVPNPEEEFLEREKGNHVIVGDGHGTFMQKQLWAFFYAYYHNTAVRKAKSNVIKSAILTQSPHESDVYVIQSLRADGILDTDHQASYKFEFDEHTQLDVVEKLAQKSYPMDGLFPAFIVFFISLKRQGYRMDRVLLPNEGWTVAVQYLQQNSNFIPPLPFQFLSASVVVGRQGLPGISSSGGEEDRGRESTQQTPGGIQKKTTNPLFSRYAQHVRMYDALQRFQILFLLVSGAPVDGSKEGRHLISSSLEPLTYLLLAPDNKVSNHTHIHTERERIHSLPRAMPFPASSSLVGSCSSCGTAWRFCPGCGASLVPPPAGGSGSGGTRDAAPSKTKNAVERAARSRPAEDSKSNDDDDTARLRRLLPPNPVSAFDIYCRLRLLETHPDMRPAADNSGGDPLRDALTQQWRSSCAQTWFTASAAQKNCCVALSDQWKAEKTQQSSSATAAPRRRLASATDQRPRTPTAAPLPAVDESTTPEMTQPTVRLLREVRGAVTSYGLYYSQQRRLGVGVKRIRDLWCALPAEEKHTYDVAAAERRCEAEARRRRQEAERAKTALPPNKKPSLSEPAALNAAQGDTDDPPDAAVQACLPSVAAAGGEGDYCYNNKTNADPNTTSQPTMAIGRINIGSPLWQCRFYNFSACFLAGCSFTVESYVAATLHCLTPLAEGGSGTNLPSGIIVIPFSFDPLHRNIEALGMTGCSDEAEGVIGTHPTRDRRHGELFPSAAPSTPGPATATAPRGGFAASLSSPPHLIPLTLPACSPWGQGTAVACCNEVKMYFTIFHINATQPILSSASLDSDRRRRDEVGTGAGGHPEPEADKEPQPCHCGLAPPRVVGEEKAPSDILNRHGVPPEFKYSTAPPRLLRQSTGTSFASCSSSGAGPTTMPWGLSHEVVETPEGQRKGYRVALTSEVLVEIRDAEDQVPLLFRPTAVSLTLLTPPCGVYLRYLLNHHELLLGLLRRATAFAYEAVPCFYKHFEKPENRGTVDRRHLNAASALLKEKMTIHVWRELKRELRSALAVTKPLLRCGRGGPLLTAPALRPTLPALLSEPCAVHGAIALLLRSDAAYTSAAVAGLLSCSDYSDVADVGWDRPAGRRRSGTSRVVIFSTELERAEALLAVASYFLRRRGGPARCDPSVPLFHPPHTDERLILREAFERAYGGLNSSVYDLRTGGTAPVDCCLPIQWVPMAYSELNASKMFSPYSDEGQVLLLCPEMGLCTRYTLQRSTSLHPLVVTPASRRRLPCPFTLRTTEETMVQDQLLKAVLPEVVRVCQPCPQRTCNVLDDVVRWLRHNAAATRCAEEYAALCGDTHPPFAGGFTTDTSRTTAAPRPTAFSWYEGITRLLFGAARSSQPATDARASHGSATKASIPPMGLQLRQFLFDPATYSTKGSYDSCVELPFVSCGADAHYMSPRQSGDLFHEDVAGDGARESGILQQKSKGMQTNFFFSIELSPCAPWIILGMLLRQKSFTNILHGHLLSIGTPLSKHMSIKSHFSPHHHFLSFFCVSVLFWHAAAASTVTCHRHISRTTSTRRAASSPRGDDANEVHHLREDYRMIPKEYTINDKIAVRSYLDRNRTELSDRTYMPQKAWFKPYTPRLEPFDRPYQQRRYDHYYLETTLIWKAFDTPELIGMFLHDECIRGNRHVYDVGFLDLALAYTSECRYWRCLGITKPFYDKDTLRAHCWEDNGLQVGTLVISQAMRHAIMDLERAARRKEFGLDPNYIWDRWGPVGFVDGARNDYLPRFEHNPYRDPDGVEVTEADVLPYNTHEQLKERYGEFIFPDTAAFKGIFSGMSHGTLRLEDIPNQEAVALFERLGGRDGGADVSPLDLRLLLFLSANERWMGVAAEQATWDGVRTAMQAVMDENNEKIDAARLLTNTRHSPERIRAFFEEKCGFHDFMHTPDKVITGAVLCYLEELRRLCAETSWGADLARALTDVERMRAMGPDAFLVYKHIEDAILDKKRRAWAARFAGEAREENTLDYLLENFGRRTTRTGNVGTTGEEFDREQEPIGRQVQRRVLDSDKANKLAEVRKRRGKLWSNKTSVFDSLHQKQLQNFTYGVR
eukprot:gene10089-7059_t